MGFQLSRTIERPPGDVYAFMKDFENHPQERSTKVLRVEKITDGSVGLGTRYREKVQMLPLLAVEMISEITRFEPQACIVYEWHGGGMRGVLTIALDAHANGTELSVHEQVLPQGLLKPFAALIRMTFRQTWERRLAGIKRVLESQRK